jgi:hypothetical protein
MIKKKNLGQYFTQSYTIGVVILGNLNFVGIEDMNVYVNNKKACMKCVMI